MQSNKDFRSRLPLPKSVFKSSIPTNVRTGSSSQISSTCIKTNVTKILSSVSRTQTALRPHPYLSASVRPTLRTPSVQSLRSLELATRLDFESSKHSPDSSKNTTTASMTTTTATSPLINWNSITNQSELLALKTQINKLETLLEESKLKSAQNSVTHEITIERLNKEIEIKDSKISDSEQQIKTFERKLEDIGNQLNNAREEFGNHYNNYETKIMDLNKIIIDLQNQLTDSRVTIESTEVRHRSELIAVQHQLKSFQTRINDYSEEKQILHKHIHKMETEAKHCQQLEFELNAANIQIRSLTEELNSYKDGIKLNDILENELRELKQMRIQNKELIHQNQVLNQLLNSKNKDLEQRVLELEAELNDTNNRLKDSLQNDNESNDLREQLAQWHQLLGTDSPINVNNRLKQLHANELSLQTQLGELQSKLNQMLSEKTKLESNVRSAQNQLTEQSKTIKNLNRKCTLYTKETDNYKRLITSYEHDVTLDWNKTCEERIKGLEEIVEEYRVLVQQMESETKQSNTGSVNTSVLNTSAHQYLKQITELKEQLHHYKTINKELEEKLEKNEALESATTSKPLSSGIDYRVIHLARNPVSEQIEEQINEMKRLSDENQRLRTKLQILETGSDADVSRQLDEGIKNTQQVEKLQQKLSCAEKRQKNIIDAFKRTSKEFREVCYRLTGFRIDLLKQNTYRLSHIYADSPDDLLLFECDADRTIKLLENEYSRKLNDLVQTYLSQYDSFPAFLASLTLDLFNKQTIVQ